MAQSWSWSSQITVYKNVVCSEETETGKTLSSLDERVLEKISSKYNQYLERI